MASAGVTFFGVDGFKLEFSYLPGPKEKRQFDGKISYDKDIKFLGVSKPSIYFFYKNGHWGFSGLKFNEDGLDPSDRSKLHDDLAKAIVKGSEFDSRSGCGKLVDMVLDETVKIGFDFNLGMPLDKTQPEPEVPHKTAINCSLDVKLSVSIVTEKIFDSELLKFDLQIPGPFKQISDIPLAILRTILNDKNIASLGKAVLDNPEAMTKLLLAVGAKKLAKETIARLLCRNIKPDPVKNRGNEYHKDDFEKFKEKVKEMWEKIKDIGEAIGSGIAAAAEVLEAAGAIFGGLLILFGVLAGRGDDGGLTEQLKKVLDGTLLQELINRILEAEKDKKALEDELRKQRELIENALNLPPDGNLKANYKPDLQESTISVNWSECKPNTPGFNYDGFKRVGWIVKIATEPNIQGSSVQTRNLDPGTFEAVVSNDEYRYLKQVYVWVAAVLKTTNETYTSRAWRRVTIPHIPWLREPSRFAFAATEDVLRLNIPPTIQDLGNYSLTLTYSGTIQPQPTTVLSKKISNPSVLSYLMDLPIIELPFADVKGDETLKASLVHLTSNSMVFHDSPAAEAPKAFAIANVPTNLVLELSGTDILATWDQAGESDSDCQIRLFAGKLEVTSQCITTPQHREAGKRAVLIKHTLQQGQKTTVAVRIKLVGVDVVYPFLKKDIIVSTPVQPSILSLSNYDVRDSVLSIQVQYPAAVLDAAAFLLQAIAFDGTKSNLTIFSSNIEATTAVLRTNALQTPFPKSARVGIVSAAAKDGTFSEEWTLPVIPSIQTLVVTGVSYKDGGLTVSWSSIPTTPPTNWTVEWWIELGDRTSHLQRKNVAISAGEVVFDRNEIGQDLKSNDAVVVQYVANLPSIVGDRSRLRFTIT